jgi:hypothetical protein
MRVQRRRAPVRVGREEALHLVEKHAPRRLAFEQHVVGAR